MRFPFSLLVFVLAGFAGIANAKDTEVMIGAAASLRDVLTEVGTKYQESHKGVVLKYNFAASSTIVRQIEAGAAVDVFFSADEKNMDALVNKDLIVKETRKDILGNSMVLIVATDQRLARVSGSEGLLNPEVKTIALCDDGVPIGHYARMHLEANGILRQLKAAIVKPENVRGVVSVVQSHAADAGYIYATDIKRDDKSVRQIPIQDTTLDIRYPAAVIKGTKSIAAATDLVEYLAKSLAARDTYKKWGFKAL